MKYFLVTVCLTLLLASRISSKSCDLEEFRTCYLNAETAEAEESCLTIEGCEEVAEDFKNPLEIDIPVDETE